MQSLRPLISKAPLPSHAPAPERKRQSRHRHTDDEWAARKPTILELYRAHIVTTVIELLDKEHHFKTSVRNLQNKIKEWGEYRKNVSRADMAFIVAKKEQRLQLEGKDTEFSYHNEPLSEERLQRFSKRENKMLAVKSEPDSLPVSTPEGITYQTPDSSKLATSGILDLISGMPFEDSKYRSVPIKTTLGCLQTNDPEPHRITHKHFVGKLGIQVSGLNFDFRRQQDLLLRAYEAGLILRVSVTDEAASHPSPPSIEPSSVQSKAKFWVTSADILGPSVELESRTVGFLQHSTLFRDIATSVLTDVELWAEPWTPLEDEEGCEMGTFMDKAAGSNSTQYPDLAFIDTFVCIIDPGAADPLLVKMSLGIDVGQSNDCRICEPDVMILRYISTFGLITINVPLAGNAGQYPRARWIDPCHHTRQHQGSWRATASHIMGFQGDVSCQSREEFAGEPDKCFVQHELDLDKEKWDPEAGTERQVFQAFPLERTHVCSNGKCGVHHEQTKGIKEEFNIYPGSSDGFQAFPRNTEESWGT